MTDASEPHPDPGILEAKLHRELREGFVQYFIGPLAREILAGEYPGVPQLLAHLGLAVIDMDDAQGWKKSFAHLEQARWHACAMEPDAPGRASWLVLIMVLQADVFRLMHQLEDAHHGLVGAAEVAGDEDTTLRCLVALFRGRLMISLRRFKDALAHFKIARDLLEAGDDTLLRAAVLLHYAIGLSLNHTRRRLRERAWDDASEAAQMVAHPWLFYAGALGHHLGSTRFSQKLPPEAAFARLAMELRIFS